MDGTEARRWASWLASDASSTAIILWNAKLLLGGFPYPICLSAIHMGFQTIATRAVARYAPSLMAGGRSSGATDGGAAGAGAASYGPSVGSTLWCRTILPIGASDAGLIARIADGDGALSRPCTDRLTPAQASSSRRVYGSAI